MEHPMRRSKQLLSESETKDILYRGNAGTLALVDEDNFTYAVPITYIYTNDKLYFHSAPMGHKMDALRYHPNVSFCVIDQNEVHPDELTTYYRSAIAFGRVRIVEDEEEIISLATMFGAKFLPADKERVVEEIKTSLSRFVMLEMDIERLTGKESLKLVKMKEN